MSMPKDEWINNRAYALWEQNGRQHGYDHEHWLQANAEWEELERVALPGHIQENQGAGVDGAPVGHMAPVEHSAADVGIPPEELQYDTEESPAPRLGKAVADKKKSKTGSEILGKSQVRKSYQDGKGF